MTNSIPRSIPNSKSYVINSFIIKTYPLLDQLKGYTERWWSPLRVCGTFGLKKRRNTYVENYKRVR